LPAADEVFVGLPAGTRYLLAAGAALDPAGAAEPDVSAGELAGAGLLPPHAMSAPVVAMAARSAMMVIFFMMILSSLRSGKWGDGGLMPELHVPRQLLVVVR
jgi:hypothetical protein